ncbi:MAG: transporter substrate-binding domain-containing protein [Planctomycetes bacterium]|nr:transporter substrate-binding domain-containing protein [Planctomycetota bacterium]
MAIALLAAPSAGSTEEAFPRQNTRTIVIGTESAYPPYSFPDDNDKLADYNIEITKTLARVTGLNVRIKMAPWGDPDVPRS